MLISVQCAQELKDEIVKAVNAAKQCAHPVILSYVFESKIQDPLQAFSSFQSESAGKRFYWATPDGTFSLFGMDVELTLTPDIGCSNRFTFIEEVWKKWKQYLFFAGTHPFGTGPIMFGGFSFDPCKKDETMKWKSFHEARFTLPSVLITRNKLKSYVTINKIIEPSHQIEEIADHFYRYEQQISRNLNGGSSYFAPVLKNEQTFYKKEWLQAVQKATEQIKKKRFEKVVLAREILLEFEEAIDVRGVLEALHEQQPNCYLFVMENGNKTFIGATPERLIKKEGRKVLSACVAGSIHRGGNPAEDEKFEKQLLSDEKNLHEHRIVVKAIEAVFQQFCQEVTLPSKPSLLKTPNIQHLYTPVEGKVKNRFSLLNFVEKLHPTPALGGFPKQEALAFIREEEPLERGWYAAPVGWMDHQGNGEFVVAIRSGLICENRAYLFAGCGIVGDSIPEEELKETEMKFRPMLHALGGKGYAK